MATRKRKLRPAHPWWHWVTGSLLWAIRLRELIRVIRSTLGENGPFDL